jgi:hypothetical protein
VVRSLIFSTLLAIAVFARPAFGQQMIRIEKLFVSRSLAGIVTDRLGSPIPGVDVELRTRDWKKSLKTTTTNVNGWFGFKTMRQGIYYLTIPHQSVFAEYQIKIRVTRSAKTTPKVELELAI